MEQAVRMSLWGFYLTAQKGMGWFRFGNMGPGLWWYSEKRQGRPYCPLFSEREGYTTMPRHVGGWWFKVLKRVER